MFESVYLMLRCSILIVCMGFIDQWSFSSIGRDALTVTLQFQCHDVITLLPRSEK